MDARSSSRLANACTKLGKKHGLPCIPSPTASERSERSGRLSLQLNRITCFRRQHPSTIFPRVARKMRIIASSVTLTVMLFAICHLRPFSESSRRRWRKSLALIVLGEKCNATKFHFMSRRSMPSNSPCFSSKWRSCFGNNIGRAAACLRTVAHLL